MKGYRFNPDREYVEKILEGIRRKEGHCPCSLHADEIVQEGICKCNLFVKDPE